MHKSITQPSSCGQSQRQQHAESYYLTRADPHTRFLAHTFIELALIPCTLKKYTRLHHQTNHFPHSHLLCSWASDFLRPVLTTLPKCSPKSLSLDITGYTSHQLCRSLRKRLTDTFRTNEKHPTFLDIQPSHIYPRADEVEDMLSAHPNLNQLNYDD